jgi:putative restriction endonuclease
MVVPELNCCALDSFPLFTVSSPQIEEDPFECSATLTEILPPLAEVLIGLIGEEAKLIAGQSAALNSEAIPQTQSADLEMWEHHIEATIESDSLIPDTDRKALIVARRGQGLFKQRVMQIENRCRLTGVNNLVHLVGSHCKPWRDSSNDRGFIGFENSGELIVSPVAHAPSLNRMGWRRNGS